ncbi:MAG TPA: SURF1 family protein [Gemmatimonadales bacterium]|jgi:surfeit locus 1 family protein
MTMDRRDLIALVGAFLVAGVCVRLGIWQLDRLHQRRAHNAVVAAARARPEVELRGGANLPIDSLRDRRVRARGVYDYARERLWHGRSYEGIPGVDFVTPLRFSDSSAVLVDRGWAPSPDGYHVDAAAYREADSADVVGLGMAAPRGRGDVNPMALRDSLPYRLLPVVIQQLPPSTTLDRPLPPALTRWPPPELSDGPHLSYVVQWFSFAVIIVVGSVVLLRQRSTRRRPEGYQ